MTGDLAAPLLSVQGLTIGLRRSGGRSVSIVEDVSFDVDPSQRLGIVGESGSGKSLTLRAIAGLLPKGVGVHTGRGRYRGGSVYP
jgi:ABC-type glutathione transport system ATPase component